MQTPRSILSVGIDIGTTTTQIVFSQLSLGNSARIGQIPRISIKNRSVVYQSPLINTPLTNHKTIDGQKLSGWVLSQYQLAGIDPSQIESGAVIITGETAKKENAEIILKALAGMAGEFVVTVAGPHLESIIAGRGSGSALYSQEHYCRVSNIDVGGGSANIAIFHGGILLADSAMNFGGRILELDNQNGSIQYIADPARMILDDIGLVFNIGYIPSMAELRRFTTRIADMAAELFEGKISPLSKLLYLTPPVNQNGIGSVISFSGGVGYYIHNPVSILNIMDVSIHGDIGPLLAESILENPVFRSQAIIPPAETLRATVLGACTQTVSLSGSTIWIDKSRLPLRNIPVVKIALEQREGFENLQSKDLMNAIIKMDINPETDLCALAFDFSNSLDYDQLTNLGKTLVEYSENSLPNDHPLIVLIERDYAQVLGQTIQGLVNHRPLIVIDQVGLEGGDYIDIGMPLLEERVVPISIKTLVFYH